MNAWVRVAVLGSILALGAGALNAAPPPLVVSAGNRVLELHDLPVGPFSVFELAQPTEIEVRADFNVRWVDVRPRSAGIVATVAPDHRTVRFRMNSARPVTVEFNRDLARVLHLFPFAPDSSPPPAPGEHVRVYAPGIHDIGIVELHDDDVVYLEPGAWVRGGFRAVGAQRVVIRGHGVIDGTPVVDLARALPRPSEDAALPDYATDNANLILLKECTGAVVEGVTLINSTHWTLYLRSSEGVKVAGVNILNASPNWGNDGIDVVSSRHVRIADTFIRTSDDCIVVKNLDDRPTTDIRVERATLWNMPAGGNALELGFEFRTRGAGQIRFRNCDIVHVQRGAAISIHNGDSGTVEDVAFDDIRVEDVRRKLIDFCVLYAQAGLDRPPTEEERRRRMDPGGAWDGEQRQTPAEYDAHAAARGHVRDITVRNLAVVEGALPYSVIAGYDADHRVEHVRIEGLTYLGQRLTNATDAKLVRDSATDVVLR